MTNQIEYTLLDPTGNMTILVTTPTPEDMQPDIALRLMELEPSAEQTGFVGGMEPDSVTIRMAGGEFCGNAAMSAAALTAARFGLGSADITVRFKSAGISVPVRVAASGSGMAGTVGMPKPLSVRNVDFPGGMTLPVVFFPGIAHAISETPIERIEAEALCPGFCRFLGTEAFGLMQYDRDRGTLTPLVYVESGGTLFWESSCASGTAALGYHLLGGGSALHAAVSEPGGTLTVDSDGSSLTLSGNVRIVKTAKAEVRP